jgi:hypothetical protein
VTTNEDIDFLILCKDLIASNEFIGPGWLDFAVNFLECKTAAHWAAVRVYCSLDFPFLLFAKSEKRRI